MAEEAIKPETIWPAIQGARDVSDLQVQGEKIVAGESSGALSRDQASSMRLSVFRAARQLTEGDPDAAQKYILDQVLPLCLEQPEETDPEGQVNRIRVCTFLAEWIEDFPEQKRNEIRARVLERALRVLLSVAPEGALELVSDIGYRDPRIEQHLKELVTRGGKLGNRALSTLTSLGIDERDRGFLIDRALDSLATSGSDTPLYALQQLADPAFIRGLIDRLGQLENAHFLLTRIADRHWANLELQEAIWTALARRSELPDTNLRRWLFFGAALSTHCNTPSVVKDLLRWMIPDRNQEHPGDAGRYLGYLRLSECVRPQQLLGWHHAENAAAVPVLKSDAVRSTGTNDRFAGHEGQVKEDAWATALSIPKSGAVEWLDEIIAQESNEYVQEQIIEFATSFRYTPLPQRIKRLITEEVDFRPDEYGRGIILRLSAVDLARSAATRDAFDTILNFGFTEKGEVFTRVARAAGDLAVHLVQLGEPQIVSTLLTLATQKNEGRKRIVALGALRDLAASGLLGPETIAPLLELSQDAELKSYSRADAIVALGFLKGDETPSALNDELLRLSQSTGEGELGWRALEALIRRGHWRDYAKQINEKLGFIARAEGLVPNTVKGPTKWEAYIIGLLLLEDPKTYGPPALHMLRSTGFDEGYSLIMQLARGATRLDDAWRKRLAGALVERALKRHTHVISETYLLDVIRVLSVETLMETEWEHSWWDWLPDARAKFADVLAGCDGLSGEYERRAERLLVQLMRDAMFAVRRSAYRALASINVGTLEATTESWARSDSVELRRRAAEAGGWICTYKEDENLSRHFSAMFGDRERSVRDAARRSWRESRRRGWAKEYFKRVVDIESNDNLGVLQVFQYGRALERTGDDRCIHLLSKHLSDAKIPFHVWAWQKRLLKELEKNWKTVTRKWPEPWIQWDGIVEELTGDIIFGGKRAEGVSLSLWRKPPDISGEYGNWGGLLRLSHQPPWGFMGTGNFRIVVPGRKEAAALMTEAGSHGYVFVGTGAYLEISD